MELDLHYFSTFKIYQPKSDEGYRFSHEPFVLSCVFKGLKGKSFVDFGAGSGILSILLAINNPESVIFSVEKNLDMIEVIDKNVELNELKNVIVLKDIKLIENNSVDFFISNPPYFKKGYYRISRRFEHEKFEDDSFLEFFIKNAKRVLKNKGRMRFSYHPTRFTEAIELLRTNKFGIKNITPVYGKEQKKAAFIIIDAMLAGKDYVEFSEPVFLNKDRV